MNNCRYCGSEVHNDCQCYCHEPAEESYLECKRDIQSLPSIERCEEFLANLEEQKHPHKERLAVLVEARKSVLWFDSI